MATFAGCKITGKAGTYTLTAAATGFTTVTSNTFTITSALPPSSSSPPSPVAGPTATAWAPSLR